MTDIFNHNEKDKIEWNTDIKNYESKKKNLEWGKNPPTKKITTKIMKEAENFYDPLLQTFKDKSYEQNLKSEERKNIKNALAKNKDNQIRIEQTYDIINLKDKLNMFENHMDYPRTKSQRVRDNKDGTNQDYNIISNQGFDKHYYDKPEIRPKIKKEVNKIKKFNILNYIKLY
jgi:hypothetical protein